ncbi:putative molybdenum carrier protein [Ruegeria arenilitoris]|uniref:putative molybdenum carrier protein n=1 Tax=Ruegeria arenilitoris TaxID=1173585 RepID=UPI00147DEA0D|nr:putative molybdenum carrier protein [Ruegeria arenilitoris]
MKIVSGGQTGVDIAALDFARRNGFVYGGWVPKGRANESGRIPDHFTGLRETNSEDVAERTRRNVILGDATLIFIDGSTSPGTQLTIDFAKETGKPHLVIDVRKGTDACAQKVRQWLRSIPASVLNIAGPRASEAPQIGLQVRAILEQSLDVLSA